MRLLSLLAICFCLSFSGQVRATTDSTVVVVASAQSPISTLSLPEVRKIYLGVPVRLGDKTIQPLRNSSDPLLVEVFMQRVMYMASESYERQILNRIFRVGGERPQNFSEHRAVAAALVNNPWAISYMWRDSALNTPGLKIVAE